MLNSIYILLIYLFLLFAITKSKQSRIAKRMLYVIVSYWMISLFVSTFNPYHLYPVSFNTYFWLTVNVSSFVIGYLSIRGNSKLDYDRITVPIGVDRLFKSYKFWGLLVICIAFTLYIYSQQSAVVLAYNIGYLRQNFAELMFTGKPMLSFVYMTLLKSFYEFTLFLGLYLIIYKRDFTKIAVLLIFIVPFMFLAGGRTRAMMVAFYFIFLLIFSPLLNHAQETKSPLTFRLKHVFFISISLFLLFILFSYTSMIRLGYTDFSFEALREGVDKSLLQLCSYSIGPFRAFDIATHSNYIDMVGGYKFGQASIGGLESFLERIIRHLIGVQIPNVNESTLQYLQDTTISVGTHDVTDFNFAYTNAIYHYFDFGYIGIIIWPFLFGRFFCRQTIKAEKNPSLPTLVLVAFLFEIAIYSVFSLLTVEPFAIPYIIFLLVLIKINKTIWKKKTPQRLL